MRTIVLLALLLLMAGGGRADECSGFQLVLTETNTLMSWELQSAELLTDSTSTSEYNITYKMADNKTAHLQCSCSLIKSCSDTTTTTSKTTVSTTQLPDTPPNNTSSAPSETTPVSITTTPASTPSEAILGSATGLLLVVLVGVIIGWICTCIIMRRRHGQYHINHRHTDGYTYAHSTTSTPHPTTSCEAPDTTYSSIGQTYDTIPPRVVQSFETLTVNEAYGPARSIAKDDDTYSKLDNSVTRRQGDSEPHRVMDKYQQRVDSRIDYSTEGQDELVDENYSKLSDSKLAGDDSYSKLELAGDDSYSKLAGAASKRHDYFELEPQGLQLSANRFKIVTKKTECAGGGNTSEGAGGHEGSVCREGTEDYEVPIKRNVEVTQTTKEE